jgi:outer membrane receptor protein involved in Fe transport
MKTSKKFGPSWGRRPPRPKRFARLLAAPARSCPARAGSVRTCRRRRGRRDSRRPHPRSCPHRRRGPHRSESRATHELKVQSVYAASKHEQKISEAPASVTVVDSDEIEKYGYKSFADILRSVRGLYVTYDRNYSYLGIRGFNRPGDYNSRVLVLVNGHGVNENVFDSALLGHEFPLDVDLIDRVEVIRGPSSSIYGNNAFFGVINVITKKGLDYQGAKSPPPAGASAATRGGSVTAES